MTEKITLLLEQLKNKEYRKKRAVKENSTLLPSYDTVPADVFMEHLRYVFDSDEPLLYDGDDIGFNIGVQRVLPIGGSGNVIPNYGRIITEGLDATQERISKSMENTRDEEKLKFGNYLLQCVEFMVKTAQRYKKYAFEKGNTRLYNALCNIPNKGADSFYEALVFHKLCTYSMRNAFSAHICLGRFDDYMYPFYKADTDRGISREEMLETLQEFYASISRDTDLYFGIQQGDNGQSMVLGGFDENGNSMYNDLSKLCLEASLEMCIIEPKINLRVGKNTPDELYEFATLLTKKALGFPQYCNDDVVVPGLIRLGYDKKDAYNYAVAACWEYIIPNNGADIPNIDVMDFPYVVGESIKKHLEESTSFEELLSYVKTDIQKECDSIVNRFSNHIRPQNVMLSLFFDGCIESLSDLYHGGTRYRNFGCHGAGIANGADALCAVKKCVFEDKTVTKEQLLKALDSDFEGYENIRKLLCGCPKMGCNDDEVDSIAAFLMDAFSKSLNCRDNLTGGVWRAGTGSAMEYIYKGEGCGATADGRGKGKPYSSSFSPSLDARPDGLLSVIQSFTKYDMTNITNGGPLTIELHDTVLRNELGIKKTAMLVKSFINLGGHQLQINALDKEKLRDAQAHPENYPSLVVRVWGWSGYFTELDKVFQDHIMARLDYMS